MRYHGGEHHSKKNTNPNYIDTLQQGYYDDVTTSMAMIFVWLRYSAIRQLTWQRNYNTQPRILGAAQERLTHAIAHVRVCLCRGEVQEGGVVFVQPQLC